MIFSVIYLVSCSRESNWTIEFCTQINGFDCINNTNIFESDKRIYVILESKTPITEDIIIGRISRAMRDGKYNDYLGSKNFKIAPNTFKLQHYIPFDQLGGSGPHLIEFTKEDGTVIITKELFIK